MRLLMFLIGTYILLGLPEEANRPAQSPSLAAPTRAGIHTDDSFSVEELVQDIFVHGTCNTITNVKAIGNENGIGYFENGQNSIGMERGVMIATGPIANAEGPNEATDQSGNFYDDSGDPDLNHLATGPVKDAVGIEFDFTPLDSIVTFRYVFASEEYCEFVGSIYNDVFGFFIQGPGINGGFSNNAANVALIPGTDDYVSINSVNHEQNVAFYIHNELLDDAVACGLNVFQENFNAQIEYDGFTRILTAVLRLAPCETYHIRLVVADVGDNFYDSAVFLEAESFNLGGEVDVSAGIGLTPAAPALEGCEDAYFQFQRRIGSGNNFPLTVRYTLSPQSTAQEGIDFEPLPGQITIPAGASLARLPVHLINDGLNEPVEDIILELDIPCACFSDTARMFIDDSPPLFVDLPDIAVCGNGSNQLQPSIQGGNPDFTYQWSTGSTSSVLEVTADGPPTYSVTVFDACGNSAVDSARLLIVAPPEASLSGAATICEGDTTFLPLAYSGTPPWSFTYSIDGVVQPVLSEIWDSSYALPATLPGTYELLSIQDAGCEGYASGFAQVEVLRIQVDASVEPVSCFGGSNGRISVSLSGGTPPYNYFWANGLPQTLQPGSLAAGAYILIVTDAGGCRKESAIVVGAPPPLSNVEPDCNLLAEGRLELTATGGSPPYLYSVDGVNFYNDAFLNGLNAGQEYLLTIQDAAGCLLQQDFLMPEAYGQMVVLPEVLELKLGRLYELAPLLHISEPLIANLRWTPSVNLSCTDCLMPELLPIEENVYTIRITDVFGCSAEASVSIRINDEIDIFIPNAFSPNGDAANDRFTVYANTFQVKEISNFLIFDRWGGLLYKKAHFPPNDESAGWDGQCKGLALDPGVYTYMVEVELHSGNHKVFSGNVMLLR
ncbi:MAG: choice-of-anchor L domain-containing protein [Lewinellaceae bacterium]|nr:choice-of-anchor L domain-containing protein [Lewinellaceae bacterium]